MSYQKSPRTEVVYMHLKPGKFNNELSVQKIAKSKHAHVEPGVVIVKAKITVPGNFFDEALPFVEIEFQPGDEIQPAEVTIGVESDD